MLKFNQKTRLLIVLITAFFLWCHVSQAMAYSSVAHDMDCSQTDMCDSNVCATAIHSVSPELKTPLTESRVMGAILYTLPDPNPVSLYHPPR